MIPMPLEVKLEAFEGPLDLLLHLIRENKVDIFDIPITVIADKYLEYLKTMKELDLDISGEFLVMAATLLYIKSKMLLPVEEENEEDSGIDPRDELVRKLLEYQSFKEAAKELGMLAHERRKVYTRQLTEQFARSIMVDQGDTEFSANLYDLIQAFSSVLKEKSTEIIHEIFEEVVSIDEKVEQIKAMIAVKGLISFRELFTKKSNRNELIATFVAILELAKRRMLTIIQKHVYGDIMLQKV
ncbi:MAG: segregation/condensation protein A [Candidatus Omnitrophica bacterium]|nr:segregation/condensation protein A [Candidatus Omnitrophota bacterium]